MWFVERWFQTRDEVDSQWFGSTMLTHDQSDKFQHFLHHCNLTRLSRSGNYCCSLQFYVDAETNPRTCCALLNERNVGESLVNYGSCQWVQRECLDVLSGMKRKCHTLAQTCNGIFGGAEMIDVYKLSCICFPRFGSSVETQFAVGKDYSAWFTRLISSFAQHQKELWTSWCCVKGSKFLTLGWSLRPLADTVFIRYSSASVSEVDFTLFDGICDYEREGSLSNFNRLRKSLELTSIETETLLWSASWEFNMRPGRWAASTSDSVTDDDCTRWVAVENGKTKIFEVALEKIKLWS